MVAMLLLRHGVDPESEDRDGRIPLILAVENGHEAVVKLLLEKGSDPEAEGGKGFIPHSWATGNGHESVVKIALHRGRVVQAMMHICIYNHR